MFDVIGIDAQRLVDFRENRKRSRQNDPDPSPHRLPRLRQSLRTFSTLPVFASTITVSFAFLLFFS